MLTELNIRQSMNFGDVVVVITNSRINTKNHTMLHRV